MRHTPVTRDVSDAGRSVLGDKNQKPQKLTKTCFLTSFRHTFLNPCVCFRRRSLGRVASKRECVTPSSLSSSPTSLRRVL